MKKGERSTHFYYQADGPVKVVGEPLGDILPSLPRSVATGKIPKHLGPSEIQTLAFNKSFVLSVVQTNHLRNDSE